MWLLGLAVVAGVSSAAGQESCGLCATSVVVNEGLAECFLQRYETLAASTASPVAIDLSDCETARGIVPGLPTAGGVAELPDTEFLVSRRQLACLRVKLQDPALDLDPSLRVSLEDCP